MLAFTQNSEHTYLASSGGTPPLPAVRVRHHVNPFNQKYQHPVTPPFWDSVYGNVNQPLHLDIGCARGFFLQGMAQQYPDWNFLGLEIREPLVEEANQRKEELGLTNVHYLFGNANNSLAIILASLPSGLLQRVSIQFPDPWFKKRHQKRRVVQPAMVEVLATYMVEGGTVLLQSDVEAVAADMGDRFAAHPSFTRQGNDPWLANNPFPVSTEREKSTLAYGDPVYRLLFTRIDSSNQP